MAVMGGERLVCDDSDTDEAAWPLYLVSALDACSQLVASHQLGFLILRCLDCLFLII